MILCLLILAAVVCRITGPLPVDRPPLLARRIVGAMLDDFSWRASVLADRDRGAITTLDAMQVRETLHSWPYQAARVHRSLRLDAYPSIMRGAPADPRAMFADWSQWTRVERPVMGQPIARRAPGRAFAELTGAAA